MTAQWLSLAEIADLKLAGLPKTRRGMAAYAEREGWDGYGALARIRAGREGGGGWEYHIDLLPIWSRLDYLSRDIEIEVTEQAVPFEDDDDLTPQGRTARDARLALVAAADKFARQTGLKVGSADHYFALRYMGGPEEKAGVPDAVRAQVRSITVPNWVRFNVRTLSARNIARWRSKARNLGTEALGFDPALSRKGTGILDRAHGGEVKHYILALVVKNPAFTAESIRNTVIERYCADKDNPELADANGELKTLPNLRAFQRTLSIWKEEHSNELMRLTDPDGYLSKVEFVATGTTTAQRLNERWQIDASPLDAKVFPEGAVTMDGKRPTIYSCIDIFCRRMIILVTSTPRASAVGLLLRKTIIAWGVPEEVKTDNGSDFKAHYVQRLLRDLKIEMIPTKAYDPRAKGVVERSIRTFQHNFAARLPGFVGHNPGQRTVLENRKAFSERLGLDDAHLFGVELTFAQAAEMADHWAGVEYEHRPHSGKTMRGRTPFEVAASYQGEIRRIENIAALDMLLAPVAGSKGDGIRTVGHEGIAVNKAHYHLGTLMVGDKVLCRQDPMDLGRLRVFKPDGETYLGEAICPQLLGLDPVETIARVRATQKAMHDKVVAPIRKMARKIGPLEVANAQRAAADRRKGNLVAFPNPTAKYETAALRAALDAVTPEKPREVDARTKAEQARLISKAKTTAKPGNVAALPETPEHRYRRAMALHARMDAGQPIPAAEAKWLERYTKSSEFRGLSRMAAQQRGRAEEA
ncbi:MAG: transposase [Devosia sp.]|nr:transposase [Devosia sp.]